MIKKSEWHPSFVAATQLEFLDEPLEFMSEYQLNKTPLHMDILIKKEKDVELKNDIGKLFRTYNVIEYKNPKVTLNIDHFYKTIGYACIFKVVDHNLDEIKSKDITITVFCDSYPKKLLRKLEQEGFHVIKKYDGIYYVQKVLNFLCQIVVISELNEKHASYLVLRENARQKDIEQFIMEVEHTENQYVKQLVDAVLYVSTRINQEQYKIAKEKGGIMCESLRWLFEDEIKEERISTTIQYLKSIIDNSDMNIDAAMKLLNIPDGEREFFKNKLA